MQVAFTKKKVSNIKYPFLFATTYALTFYTRMKILLCEKEKLWPYVSDNQEVAEPLNL